MCLELGLIPLNFLIIKKKKQFSILRCILTKPIHTMIRQVFNEFKKKFSRKGDLVDMVRIDMDDLNIELGDDEIKLVNTSQ